MKSGLEIAKKYASPISGSTATLPPCEYEKLLLWASIVMPAWEDSVHDYLGCEIPTYSLYACLINRGLLRGFDLGDEPLRSILAHWRDIDASFKPRFDQ